MSSLNLPTHVRCLLRQEGNQWVLVTLEFGLAAQGSTQAEVKAKIDSQLEDYLNTAFSEEPTFRKKLLSRRAPLWAFLAWYLPDFAEFLGKSAPSDRFIEPMPHLAVA